MFPFSVLKVSREIKTKTNEGKKKLNILMNVHAASINSSNIIKKRRSVMGNIDCQLNVIAETIRGKQNDDDDKEALSHDNR